MPDKPSFSAFFADLFPEGLAPFFRKKTVPAPPSDPDIVKTILLNGQSVTYRLRRSARRTIGLQIDDTGLRVTAPKRAPLYAIEHALRDKHRWILGKLDEYRHRPPPPAPPCWQSGARLPYLGRTLTLFCEQQPDARAPFIREDGDRLIVTSASTLAGAELAACLQTWLKQQAYRFLAERLRHHATRMNVRYDAFALSGARTRWGSCSSRRHIRLNWRLIHCAPHLIDYVIIHELAHLTEMNHSPRFWAIVRQWYPHYRQARDALKPLSIRLWTLFGDTP